jgi:hypothetical protein
MSMSLDALFKLAEERAAEEEAKPLEQRRREYRQKHGAYWETSEEGKLCLEFYRAYTAYKQYLEENSRDWREGNDTPLEFEEHQVYDEIVRTMGTAEGGGARRAWRNQQFARSRKALVLRRATCKFVPGD